MESALDVLSRAATMVQDNANEARLTTKELPTTKWRRDRRLRAEYYNVGAGASSNVASPPGTPPPALPPATAATLTSAAHGHSPTLGVTGGPGGGVTLLEPPSQMSMMMMAAAAAAGRHALCETTNCPTPTSPSPVIAAAYHHNMESPIDMSVTSTTLKQRSSPPPPYREPLPGSTYATSLARPSVITQAPPKREARDNILILNREADNRSTESISMCETVIDEHFRRSLGPDYVALFGKKSPAPVLTPSPQPTPMPTTTTPTPPPPPAVSSMLYEQPAPPYHSPLPHTQALISPKPTSILLSPAAMANLANHLKSEANSPRLEKMQVPPPPQLEPQPLTHRSNSPCLPLKAVPMRVNSKTRSNETPTNADSPASPASPLSSSGASINNNTTLNPVPVISSTTPPAMPAIVRIKTEPGLLAATTTPPASPTSSNASVSANSEVLASVDDHFAKALGDTWKKLQESREMRK